jgi:hypothetical protein
MNPEELNTALAAIGERGVLAFDEHESAMAIKLIKMQVGGVAEILMYAQNDAGSWERLKRLREFVNSKALDDLHWACYTPGTGSWFTATVTVYRDGRVETDFDYDSDPRATDPVMEIPLTPEALRREIEMFPRDEENWPEWFKTKRAEFGLCP